jgi:hypothetical protein
MKSASIFPSLPFLLLIAFKLIYSSSFHHSTSISYLPNTTTNFIHNGLREGYVYTPPASLGRHYNFVSLATVSRCSLSLRIPILVFDGLPRIRAADQTSFGRLKERRSHSANFAMEGDGAATFCVVMAMAL